MDAYLKRPDLSRNDGQQMESRQAAVTYHGRRTFRSNLSQPILTSIDESTNTSQQRLKPVLNELCNPAISPISRKHEADTYESSKIKRSKPSAVSTQHEKPVKTQPRQYEQLHLNLGQRAQRSVKRCNECLMEYSVGKAEDEALHDHYHRAVLEGIAFNGYKESQVLERGDDGAQMVLVSATGSTSQKLLDVVEQVNKDLGGVPLSTEFLETCKCIFYVSSKKHILGCVIAEPLKNAFHVIPQDVEHESNQATPAAPSDSGVIRCGYVIFSLNILLDDTDLNQPINQDKSS
ncbi:hypothetical protein SmJEL517_g05257 [Synchytrium microbalum]|uniref:N-acetyltransferase ESCO zinc-finger domain-containing protein n=1 Tax=Synchytrium microbalum TaxID=1806994 RepID=A0A507C0D0_9FUNG|nr:uncharacterized protein SmJEL517_g05257 [Synchytrium microbalum]TPX31426.1 hypothetical protein SmJEL517_g05257 [Synchytrium microbalum]